MAVKYKIEADQTQVYFDPMTFSPQIQHPLIYFDMNDIKFHLKKEIQEWLLMYCKDRWSFDLEEGNYYLHFEKDSDATIFKLHLL